MENEYSPPPSHIFGPFDSGNGVVWADPFRIRRRILHFVGSTKDINDTIQQWKDQPPNPKAAEAFEMFLHSLCVAFELSPWDRAKKAGLLEQDIVAIWNAWIAFEDKKKETGGGSPTTSPSTDNGHGASTPPVSPPWIAKSTTPSPSSLAGKG